MNDIYNFLGGLLFAGIMLSCNNLLKHPSDKDNGRAPAPTQRTNISFQQDTIIDNLHITASTQGDATMRNLLVIVRNKQDSTRVDSFIERDIKGQMKKILIADLDGNGTPELYCYMLSEGSGKFGKIYAYDLSGDKIAHINTNAIDTMELPAYRGYDSFYIDKKSLVRAFPVFKEGSPDAIIDNKKWIIRYNLRKNNDFWLLLPDH